MLGRDLIVYILQNNLENEPIFENGKLIGFITADEAAIQLNVGLATIDALFKQGILKGVRVGNELFINSSSLQLG